jgi:phage shock protein A
MERPTRITQLATAGEDAIERIISYPLAQKALEAGQQIRTRFEKLVASVADLDGRVTRIEERLDALEGKKKPAAARKPSASGKAATPAAEADAPAAEDVPHPGV